MPRVHAWAVPEPTNSLQQITRCRVTLFGPPRFIGMRRSHFYHAQADHARRLADITVQQKVEEILRRVSGIIGRLADDVAAGEALSRDPEMLQGCKPQLSRLRRTRSPAYPPRRNPSAR